MKKQLTYAVYSDIGNRDVNEDSLGVCSNNGNNCFVVCDGLGGHGMGDVASSTVVEVFKDQFEKNCRADDFLGNAFYAGQDVLMAKQMTHRAKRKMKTTAVAMVTDDKYAHIGHIGDSRLYIFRKNKVKVRTLDHSIPQMLVLSKQLKESEIRNHPDRNIVLRVMGVEWEEPMYELMKPIPLKKCDAFLLCTDGFWELIDENAMCMLLKQSGDVAQWLNAMANTVKMNGMGKNPDNNSAIAVWCK